MTSVKARREESTSVAEGIHLVQSFLATGRLPTLYACAESALKNREIAEAVRVLGDAEVPQVVLADSLFESIARIHAAAGILILFPVEQPTDASLAALQSSVVLLEEVQDPGNLGTILRTAAAVGIQDVFLSAGCASSWSPKALRAGMGAQFSLSVREDVDLAEIINTVQIPTIVTSLAPPSQSLYETDLKQPVAWLFGSEGQGVSPALAQRAAMRVLIPQVENSVESLNVAAAAAVCLYEQYRQKNVQRVVLS